MFGQTFEPHDLILILLLIVLEGVLSIDNALVLGLLAKRLPRSLQKKALTFGLVGAFGFRVIAIVLAAHLLEWRIVKLIGGAYLLYVALKHFFWDDDTPEDQKIAVGADGLPIRVDAHSGEPLTTEQLGEELVRETHGCTERTEDTLDYSHASSTHSKAFWYTVGAIELTDIAFAVDSVLAAIALVGTAPEGTPADARHPKLWVIITGGMLGVVLMRFAAVIFIRLLEKFPRFEVSAYLLVTVIGAKLVADWAFNSSDGEARLDFHSASSAAFWVFWISMLVCFAIGFIPRKKPA